MTEGKNAAGCDIEARLELCAKNGENQSAALDNRRGELVDRKELNVILVIAA